MKILATLVLGFTVLTVCDAKARCQRVPYHKTRDYGALVHVSLRPSDFTIDNTICIGQELRNNRDRWDSFSVAFFSSRDAAESFQPAPVERSNSEYLKSARGLHITYTFERNTSKEYLWIMPDGFEGAEAEKTRVDLPRTGTTECHVEIHGRCVLILPDIDYPPSALQATVIGAIAVGGTITRKGAISGVHLVNSDGAPPKNMEPLINAAIDNLSKWRVEPAANEDTMQIIYSFAIDNSASQPEKKEVRWALPNNVTVTATRP